MKIPTTGRCLISNFYVAKQIIQNMIMEKEKISILGAVRKVECRRRRTDQHG
jgi:hypothetical protein